MSIHSLRARIIIIIFAFILVKGAVFYFYTIYTKKNYEQLRIEKINETVRYETEIVNKQIAQIEQSAVIYALGGLLSKEEQFDEFGERFSGEYLLGFPSVVGGGFWFESYKYKNDLYNAGFYAYYDKSAGIVKPDDTFNIDEYDYHNRNWYRELAENIKIPYKAEWTRPYVDDSGTYSLMTTAGAGIFDENGQLIGVSTIDWEISDVIEKLAEVKPTENSFIVICVPEKDYIISGTYKDINSGGTIESLPFDITSDSFILDGKKHLRFGKYMDNGWLMSVQVPENEIFSELEINNRIFSLAIIISASFMLMLAYLVVSKYVNDPLKKLTEEVSKIALGNLDLQIDISSDDELGQFAGVLNKMTADLKNSIEENMRQRRKSERLNIELSIAMGIQESILPSVFPPFPDRNEFDIYASMHPAREVGGDLYDFYFIDNNNLAVVIADVSGKGIPAALFMVITKTLIKNCSLCKSPKMLMESVNNKLCEGNEESIFVTAFVGFYNIPTGRFVFINAGHNPPLLKKQGKGFEYLRTKPCIVLAFQKNAEYREEEIYLEKDDILYLYTDGVTEAVTKEREMFGEQRLLDTVNQFKDSAPKEILLGVKNAIDDFTEGCEQADDITMLALKIGEPFESKIDFLEDAVNEFEIEAKIENLGAVTAFINKELENYEYPADIINEIDIAVEEVFINIVKYAYEKNGSVMVSVFSDEKITIRFEDTGKPYNPLEYSEPDLEISPEEREIGGLGIFMVKKIMDKVEYTRAGDKNVLELIKKLP